MIVALPFLQEKLHDNVFAILQFLQLFPIHKKKESNCLLKFTKICNNIMKYENEDLWSTHSVDQPLTCL